MKRLTFLLLLLTSLSAADMRAQLLAVKTNALLDVAMVPNLGLEVITGGKTSLNASVFGTTKVWGKDVQLAAVVPEFRYWFNGRPMTREYIGVSATFATYDITWGGQRYKGDAYAGALTFGYDFYLGPHWSLECHAGFGLYYYDQQNYYVGDRIRDKAYNSRGLYLLPYNIGVTFAWIINSKAKDKRKE